MITKPTVGRKLWFYPHDSDSIGEFGTNHQPLDATVIYVHDDRKVNLFVISAQGQTRPMLEVRLRQDDDNNERKPYCAWMPYQQGQAQQSQRAQVGGDKNVPQRADEFGAMKKTDISTGG